MMDYVKIRRALRYFWLGYAILMISMSLAAVLIQGYTTLLFVTAVGMAVFWAAKESPRKRGAAITLQLFFGFVVLNGLGALVLGDLISPGLSLALIAISLFSLFVWRKAVVAPAEESPPD